MASRTEEPQGQNTEQQSLMGDQVTQSKAFDRLMDTETVMIVQKLNLWEAVLGCCEQTNKYQVLDAVENGNVIFNMQEESECKERCFCAPNHTFNIKLVAPGSDTSGNVDWSNPFTNGDVQMEETMLHRLGCCTKNWLCCFTCGESCTQVADIFPDSTQVQYKLEEKSCGSCSNPCVKPELIIYELNPKTEEKRPVAIIQCPRFFGGCSEACFDSNYVVNEIDEKTLDSVQPDRSAEPQIARLKN
eukprot:UN31816